MEEKRKNIAPTEIHRLTGIPIRTLQNWSANGTIPKSHDLSLIVKSILLYKDKQIEDANDSYSDEDHHHEKLLNARIRLTEAQAEKEELNNSKTKQELVSALDVSLTWSKAVSASKAKLTTIPLKLANELTNIDNPLVIQQILEDRIHEVLTELGSTEFVQSIRDN